VTGAAIVAHAVVTNIRKHKSITEGRDEPTAPSDSEGSNG
jgi:hypothetical protein